MWKFSLRMAKDRVFIIAVSAFTILTVYPLLHIIYSVARNGLPVIMEKGPTFFTGGMSEAGIGPAIAGTFLLVLLSSLIGLPIAFLVGVYAYEYPDSLIGRTTQALLQIMLEFPTVLVGVFVMDIIVLPMGTFSALAGAFALAIIMMPYVAVYTKEAMRQIPFTYREASFGLGVGRVKAIFRILVPLAKRGITTGILISMAKVAGETAPLLFTAGGLYESYPTSVTEPVGAIPLLIYTLIQSPSKDAHSMAWGASLVLLIFFLGVFIPIRRSLKVVRL